MPYGIKYMSFGFIFQGHYYILKRILHSYGDSKRVKREYDYQGMLHLINCHRSIEEIFWDSPCFRSLFECGN